MRTLLKNKVQLYYVPFSAWTDEVDADGNYTGEKIASYGSPNEISINIYPAGSEIVEQIFGKEASFDMVAVSNEIVLDEFGLLFTSLPTGNYDTTYDYKIHSISKSLNTYAYGLRRRT